MRISTLTLRTVVGALALTGASMLATVCAHAAGTSGGAQLDDATCLSCHDGGKQGLTTRGADGKKRPLHAIPPDRFARAVHGDMRCVACHQEITDNKAPHRKTAAKKPDCVSCHEGIWETVVKEKLTNEKARLGLVVQNIEAYKQSFHARQNEDDPTRPNATCDNCHDTHTFNVPPKGTTRRTEWHLTVPKVCGEQCHTEQLDAYVESVHGAEVAKKNLKAAVCTDCHTSHAIGNTSLTAFKQLISRECGSCHKENYRTYSDTYHGQVSRLGYAYTAKCYNCHGSHDILKADDPEAKVHPDNRLKTCQECHDGKKMPKATAGFTSFGPHAHANDFKRYPQMWIASRFMLALLLGVFAFFWAHSGLWYYREYKDRKEHKSRPHVKLDELPKDTVKHVRRFGRVWRIAHLLFAIITMALILTGMTVFYAESAWAPIVVKAMGGPNIASWIHRIAATAFLGIFLAHLLYVVTHLARLGRNFKWFGPDSLVPNWQDLKDIIGMFRWFIGKGPRPIFDRWTYWEKFDYWAVFWGVSIIGGSGLLLAFPHLTATILPGWIFNVATLVHGEEAFLAAVFLFTVHFFNNHFRPDKLPPPDIVMFTGSVSVEEFRREHTMQYNRLVQSGELEKYLVDAPSRPMTLGSRILGLTLIAIGLTLLVLVTIGFVSALTAG